MWKGRTILIFFLAASYLLTPYSLSEARQTHKRHHRHHSLEKKAAWAGAGVAVGRVAGPAGSLGLGAVKHRRALRAGGHARNKALVKIGAPVAATAAFGPAGTVAYQGVAHRRWVKHHLLPNHHHRHHRHAHPRG